MLEASGKIVGEHQETPCFHHYRNIIIGIIKSGGILRRS